MSPEQFDIDDRPPALRGNRVVRFALGGLAAGMTLGLILWAAGLLSRDAAIRFMIIANLVALGGGIGTACGYGPRRLFRKISGLNQPGASVGEYLLLTAFSAFRGLIVGPVAVAIAAFVIGGIGRVAPCHSAPDFISGAIFGVFAFTAMLGIPAAVIGAVMGGLLAILLYRWRFLLPYIDLPLVIITLMLTWLYVVLFMH